MKKHLFSLLMLSFSITNPQAAKATAPNPDFREMESFLNTEVSSGYVESRSFKTCDLRSVSSSKADRMFMQAQNKIMDVNSWASIIGIQGQTFRLFNSKGQLAKRLAKINDLIEIGLPMDPTGRTYWVKVEKLEGRPAGKNGASVHLIVRPTANPLLPKKNGVTDHFFEKAATNSFIISRTKTTLTAEVHGINEKANTSETRTWSDAAFNLTISEMGWGIQSDGQAGLGFQKLVWNRLNAKLADCE